MDSIQLTFYGTDAPPRPAPAPKVKIEKISQRSDTVPRVTMIRELPTSEQPVTG